jgi:protein-disulfide isomerase
LEENPNLVIEAMRRYEENQQRAEDEKAQKSIETNLSKLTDKNLPSYGNPEADVTVIEFFDYNCGYCKRAVPDIQEIVKNDDNVRFVFKEMPILGPSSKTAAQYALAAHKQGKYFDFHVALMEHRGQKNEATMEKIGKELDLDIEQLTKDAKSEEINQEIEDIITLASDIGIRGTPAFIVEGELFRGYLGPDGLANEIKEAREDKNEIDDDKGNE